MNDIVADMQAHHELRVREELNRKPINVRSFSELKRLSDLTGSLATKYLREIDLTIKTERDQRIAAARAGPVFRGRDIVEVCAPVMVWNNAMSPRPPVGLQGRVVRMVKQCIPECDDQIGLVQVSFPPGPLGYKGRGNVNYYVPNVVLRKV